MATFFYQKTNLLTLFNLFLFFISFLVAHAVSDEADEKTATDVAVSFELTLMCCITLENLCVAWVLHQYKNMHILFEAVVDNHHNEEEEEEADL